MSANANISPYQSETDSDYIDEFTRGYLETHGSQSLWNDTQLHIILEATVPIIEVIISTLQDFPGSAIYLLQLFKKVNGISKDSKNEIRDKSVCEVMNNIFDSEGDLDLKLLTSQFWPLHHLCGGLFWRHEFHLEDYQSPHVLSDKQIQEAHTIIDTQLEKAIVALSKLENQSYHPRLKPPEEKPPASPSFFKRKDAPTSTEAAKKRKIQPHTFGKL